MSDGLLRPEDDTELVTRLEGWFDDEVRRARADLSISTRSVARTNAGPTVGNRSRMTSWLAPLVVAILVVGGTIAAGSALRRDPPTPRAADASVSPKPVASDEPELPAIDITGWYWDGVPASINREHVSRPDAVARVGGGSGSGLVGGWVVSAASRCGFRAECPAVGLRASAKEGPTTPILAPDIVPPWGHIAVYSSEDAGARLVWSADPASFIAGRTADGIPAQLDGVEVHPVSDLQPLLARTPDDRAILVAGWLGGIPLRCAAPPLHREAHPLLPWCNGNRIGDQPRQVLGSADRSTPLVIEGASPPPGRVVLRVHHRDPRSESCLEADRALCEAAIVVEAVVWSGDEWTETSPLAIEDVVDRLRRAGLVREVIRSVVPTEGVRCQPDFPPEMWNPVFEASTVGGPVGTILVFASVGDRARVGAQLRPDGFVGRAPDGNSCITIADSATGTEWVAVDNVIVQVPVHFGEDPEDTQQRVDAVDAALRGE